LSFYLIDTAIYLGNRLTHLLVRCKICEAEMMFTYDSVKYHVKKSHKITLKHYKVRVIAKCAKLPNCRYGTESACTLRSGSLFVHIAEHLGQG
jgi:hypothetical protein